MRRSVRRFVDELAAIVVDGRSPARNIPLPPRRLRAGGEHFRSDAEFVESGRDEARSLAVDGCLTSRSSLLDFGCGAGRLAVGLLEEEAPLERYAGVDVRASVIRWAHRNLARLDPRFSFVHMDVANERYNPRGRPFQEQHLPFRDMTFSAAYSYSVFSHLRIEDTRSAFRELRRVVRKGSLVVITAFVDDSVNYGLVVNPRGYGALRWRGPLHCVLYQRSMFETIAREKGFEVSRMTYRSETDGQSRYVFKAV